MKTGIFTIVACVLVFASSSAGQVSASLGNYAPSVGDTVTCTLSGLTPNTSYLVNLYYGNGHYAGSATRLTSDENGTISWTETINEAPGVYGASLTFERSNDQRTASLPQSLVVTP